MRRPSNSRITPDFPRAVSEFPVLAYAPLEPPTSDEVAATLTPVVEVAAVVASFCLDSSAMARFCWVVRVSTSATVAVTVTTSGGIAGLESRVDGADEGGPQLNPGLREGEEAGRFNGDGIHAGLQ